jgi:predicted transcriptional regulator of viral defense system
MDIDALTQHGLILTKNVGNLIDEPRSLLREVSRGRLIHLRRGAFVDRIQWDRLGPRERHILRIRAVIAAAERPVIVGGISAAAIWGMPIAGAWPNEVSLLDEWRGGGRTEPGVRRSSAGYRSARTVELDGFRVTDLARTTLDVVRRAEFTEAVGSLDWALWRSNRRAIDKLSLIEDIHRLDSRLGIRRLERVVEFGTDLSDSFGESQCRGVIHVLGFEPPELQVEFRDSEGCMYPDFYWETVRRAAEFDGKLKYTRGEFTGGDPSEVVWREKKRTDRLLRQIAGVERILTEHVMRPQRLARLLLDAGIPRGGR